MNTDVNHNNGYTTIEHLYELLPNAVLLPIPARLKGPVLSKWPDITFADTQTAIYQKRLAEHDNTGVLLGPQSGNLCAIDLDSDDAVEPFLALNPVLRNTLRSRGARGCQILVYIKDGRYPPGSFKLTTPDGKPWGEWRGSNCQSVVRGIHPKGMHYQLLCDVPPVHIDFGDIKWPADMVLPWEKVAPKPVAQPASRLSVPASAGLSKRIRAYLAKPDPAIEGLRGSDVTYRIACVLVWGFALDPEEALPFLAEYSQRCQPPWSELEIQHKLNSALKDPKHQKPRGYLLNEPLQKDEEHLLDGPKLKNGNPRFAQKLEQEQADSNTSPKTVDEKNKRQQLILPSGTVDISETARNLFPQLAKTHKNFVRGRIIVELVRNKEGNEILTPLRATAFRTRVEEAFELWVWRVLNGQSVLKRTICPKDVAESLIESNPAADLLPGIRILTSAPILAERNGQLAVLNKGYHDLYGGVYVERQTNVANVALEEAKNALLDLLSDFDFTTNADRSRAIASFISPALRFGRLLNADFPLDLAEADQSQSGKTYRQLMVCAAYGERSYVVTRRERGVGSLDESISSALLSGRPFIAIENVRGIMDSQILESSLRGHGHVNVRVPHRGEVQLPTDHICWQLSSNQAATTRDLSNRSIITRLRKRPLGYKYKPCPEGDMLTHIRRRQGYYLGCVFAVVRAWAQAGKPRTDECRHDFREWSQTMDWIVQNVFNLPPLLDGHREEQERISNPHLNWLRDVAIIIEQINKLDEGFRVSELVDLCASKGLEVPGHRTLDDGQQPMLAGKILNKLFRDTETLSVGGFQVRRDQREEYNSDQRKNMKINYYWFERPNL